MGLLNTIDNLLLRHPSSRSEEVQKELERTIQELQEVTRAVQRTTLELFSQGAGEVPDDEGDRR